MAQRRPAGKSERTAERLEHSLQRGERFGRTGNVLLTSTHVAGKQEEEEEKKRLMGRLKVEATYSVHTLNVCF